VNFGAGDIGVASASANQSASQNGSGVSTSGSGGNSGSINIAGNSTLANVPIQIPIQAQIPVSLTEVSLNVSNSSTTVTKKELAPVEVDLEIELTPVIYENGVEVNVFGDLDTYNGYDDEGFPRINTRSFQTQVRMGEGQEIVLGGIARSETSRATNKPPALGSLPVLGFLFGQENTRRRESTVVMTLGIDQIVRFDGDQAGKTAGEDAILRQALGSDPDRGPEDQRGADAGHS
jgi:type II secretory pathway component GspD/PulD (secretin)